MNIPLSGKSLKKKGVGLGYGLNNRTNKGSNPIPTNVFGEDDDNENDVHTDHGGRNVVNQQISKEQDALRKRAQAALKSVDGPSVYDYDDAYESFKTDKNNQSNVKDVSTQQDQRKSKYIGELLKAAKVRGRERDAIYERRIAREQAEEDAKEEYLGKEKFVTNAYKRKLEERKQWELEQEEKEKEEVANDVTKKSAVAAFASFYGNLNKNVAVGGTLKVDRAEDESSKKKTKAELETLDDFDPRGGFTSGFEQSTTVAHKDKEARDPALAKLNANPSPEPTSMSMRERRARKVAQARIRHLKRMEEASTGSRQQ